MPDLGLVCTGCQSCAEGALRSTGLSAVIPIAYSRPFIILCLLPPFNSYRIPQPLQLGPHTLPVMLVLLGLWVQQEQELLPVLQMQNVQQVMHMLWVQQVHPVREVLPVQLAQRLWLLPGLSVLLGLPGLRVLRVQQVLSVREVLQVWEMLLVLRVLRVQ